MLIESFEHQSEIPAEDLYKRFDLSPEDPTA